MRDVPPAAHATPATLATLIGLAGLISLAGCPMSGGSRDGECQVDSDCGPEICARDGHCIAERDVREARASWTLGGIAANAAVCSEQPDLSVTFTGDGPGEQLGFSPVPCAAGTFFIDRLPRSYRWVEIGFLDNRAPAAGPLDRDGAIVLDLALDLAP